MCFFFCYLLKILLLIIFILISVAFFTLAERKILASTQRRRGPNVIGFYGLLQPIADGVKLFMKESIFPSSSDSFLFGLAPLITFIVSLWSWVVIPFDKFSFLVELDLSALFLLSCSSLGVYGILIAGWASNSKYAFLGAMRSSAQMISYEIPLGIGVSIIALCTGSYNLNQIVTAQVNGWFVFFFPLLFFVFFICGVAETNRHPFDLPEAEAELVSGYNVEYSAMGFALFSLGEYSNILAMSAFVSILFFGAWLPLFNLGSSLTFFWFGIKIIFFVLIFVLLRAGLPRYRYDQLMNIGWQNFLIGNFNFYILVYSTLYMTNSLPF